MKRGIPVFLFACTVGLGQQYVAERAIVFVLVGGALRDLHNHADNLGSRRRGRYRKGAWGSYRSSAWAVITMASPRTAAIIFMVVHVFKLCGTVMPKYCVTSQKPESLT